MVTDFNFFYVIFISLAGLVLSIFIEQMMTPKPLLARHWASWALHVGVWLFAYALLTLILGRPLFAMATVSAFFLMLVLVNNAKFHSLNEPFVWHDFDYFTDAIKYPRLYIPFLGWGKFIFAVIAFLAAISVGFFAEEVVTDRFSLGGQFGGIIALLCVSILSLIAGNSFHLKVNFDPHRDIVQLGFLASLWRYAQESQTFPIVDSVYDFTDSKTNAKTLPNMVVIQSESFFDIRELFSGINTNVLSEFDKLKEEALLYGKLKVPAWGANTIRSEFSFLTGLDETELGVHRFNPYRAVVKGWKVRSLANYLKHLGYRTIAIHPYPASFYQRSRVYPTFGFDEFFDIQSFTDAEHKGPFVSDLALAEKIKEVLNNTQKPVFIFTITMENHGPLHLEKVTQADVEELYRVPPPEGCDDMTIYLRHLHNADKMISSLRQTLEESEHPAQLCWYGDHVPIMPKVYKTFGVPDGEVDYIIWSNKKSKENKNENSFAHELSTKLLSSL